MFVGRNFIGADPRAGDARGRGADQHGARAQRGIESCGGKCRDDVPAADKEQRHAPHHAVAIGIDGEAAWSLRRRGKDRQAAHDARERREERARIAGRADRRRGEMPVSCGRRLEGGADAKHRRQPGERRRERGVVARQRRERAFEIAREAGIVPGDLLGRGAVGLGEEDVDAERARTAGGNPVDEARKQRARPRPLPIGRFEAVLVDRDHDDRRRALRARHETFFEIEAAQSRLLDRRGIERAQHQKKRHHDEGGADAGPRKHGARRLRRRSRVRHRPTLPLPHARFG